VLPPALTVIDGIIAMEGMGPITGKPVNLGLLIAGRNVVSVDAVAAKIMGFDPMEIPTIRLAAERGLGTADLGFIEIAGETLEDVIHPFERAPETLEGATFQKIKVVVKGACSGCADLLCGLEQLADERGFLSQWEDTTIVMGSAATPPDSAEGPLVLVGNCTARHRDRGVFLNGCPPIGRTPLIEAVNESIELWKRKKSRPAGKI